MDFHRFEKKSCGNQKVFPKKIDIFRARLFTYKNFCDILCKKNEICGHCSKRFSFFRAAGSVESKAIIDFRK